MSRQRKELERRLSNAYNSGLFDGYHEGVDDTHMIWVNEIDKVKGIGPKRKRAILLHMTSAMEKRQEQRQLSKNTLLREVISSESGAECAEYVNTPN